FQKDQAWHGLPLSYRALFPVFSIDPLTTKNTHTLRKIKILQIPYLKQLVNGKLMCSDVLQSADPSRGRLYGESFTNCPRFICESRFIIMLL
ncbi:hypothetical protein, partial [Klebsiella quasipneumoniae]|uniref:hypothetical protein n=1 Tax=Klebsiella quasipneumoniae TaxID=1463165 RepID=UPI00222ED3F6